MVQYLPWFVVMISLCPKSDGESPIWFPPTTVADKKILVLACLYCLRFKSIHKLLPANFVQQMVSIWLCFVIIKVSKDKKHRYYDDLLIICKSNQTSELTRGWQKGGSNHTSRWIFLLNHASRRIFLTNHVKRRKHAKIIL